MRIGLLSSVFVRTPMLTPRRGRFNNGFQVPIKALLRK